MFSGVGLLLGLGVAVVWHYTRLPGDIGWTVYGTPQGAVHISASPHPSWWPTLVAVPAVGVALGWFGGAELSRFGWRLSRNTELSVGGATSSVEDEDTIGG
jgi:hypothetical protein